MYIRQPFTETHSQRGGLLCLLMNKIEMLFRKPWNQKCQIHGFILLRCLQFKPRGGVVKLPWPLVTNKMSTSGQTPNISNFILFQVFSPCQNLVLYFLVFYQKKLFFLLFYALRILTTRLLRNINTGPLVISLSPQGLYFVNILKTFLHPFKKSIFHQFATAPDHRSSPIHYK